MALPKFSELSLVVQVGVIVVVGGLLWGASEYTLLQPIREENTTKQSTAARLERENAPLREYRERLPVLIRENEQLEAYLQNLMLIVPSEKEVDNFVRQVQSEASLAGINLRRFTAQAPIAREFHVELPFEVELDGSYFDVRNFYDRLGRLERIINVSELRMGGIEAGRGVGGRRYPYGPNETVVAVCTVTTFFSREQQPAPATPATTAAAGAAQTPTPAR